jgi:hypothetical protein
MVEVCAQQNVACWRSLSVSLQRAGWGRSFSVGHEVVKLQSRVFRYRKSRLYCFDKEVGTLDIYLVTCDYRLAVFGSSCSLNIRRDRGKIFEEGLFLILLGSIAFLMRVCYPDGSTLYSTHWGLAYAGTWLHGIAPQSMRLTFLYNTRTRLISCPMSRKSTEKNTYQ